MRLILSFQQHWRVAPCLRLLSHLWDITFRNSDVSELITAMSLFDITQLPSPWLVLGGVGSGRRTGSGRGWFSRRGWSWEGAGPVIPVSKHVSRFAIFASHGLP